MLEPRPGRGLALHLGQPVHHAVAAVVEDHEQHADLVARGAPERLDRVERGPVPHHRHHGPLGRAMRTPIGAESPNPSPPIAALRNPSGRRAGMRACSSGRLDGDSSTSTDVLGQALPQGGQHVAGPQRLARPGRRGRLWPREPRRRRTRTGAHRPGQLRAHRRRLGQQHQLGGAAVRLGRVVGHERDPGALAPRTARARTGTGGTPPPPPPARGRGRPARRAAARAQRAGGRRTAGGPAGTRRARRTTPARPGSRASRPAPPAPPRSRPSRLPRPTTSAGERASSTIPASSATASGSAARPPPRAPAPPARGPTRRAASQSSIGTITSAGPRPGAPRATPAPPPPARPARAPAARPTPGSPPPVPPAAR